MNHKISIYYGLLAAPIALLIRVIAPEYSQVVFVCAAIALIPVARLISEATEQLSFYAGDAIGGMLNATFGNLPEMVIILAALQSGLYEMVLASLVGGILANLLLANGLSFLIGGFKNHVQEFNPVSARVYGSMMLIACISMIVPAIFNNAFSKVVIIREEYLLNIGLAIFLLITYVLYLVFMLKTHRDFFKPTTPNEETVSPKWTLKRALVWLLCGSLLAAITGEMLVSSVEPTAQSLGLSTGFVGMIVLAIIGGAAESLSAIQMAKKNKMDLSLGITFESCIQISLLLAPVAVISSYFMGNKPFNLAFNGIHLSVLFLGVLVGAMVTGDGKSNWYKGVQLIMVYLIIAALFYFIPEAN
ncbi:MAG: calcium/proton exchanger [Bacteroidia bacterium]|jgi:Ca2+:H+ antiporter|nr:calcium/proton exchanger [Bacteroidia bacterium]